MTLSQLKPKQHSLPKAFAVTSRSVGFFCLLALSVSGCTSLQAPASSAQQASPVNESGALSAKSSAAEAPPASEEKPAATVSDDKVIYFPLRVAIVDDAGKQKLRQHAQYLKQNPKSFVMLLGYIDDEGSRSYNLAITEQRILAVRKLLRTYGAPMKQIRRKSEKTQSKCASADCRQKMRKVELIFSP